MLLIELLKSLKLARLVRSCCCHVPSFLSISSVTLLAYHQWNPSSIMYKLGIQQAPGSKCSHYLSESAGRTLLLLGKPSSPVHLEFSLLMVVQLLGLQVSLYYNWILAWSWSGSFPARPWKAVRSRPDRLSSLFFSLYYRPEEKILSSN